MGGNLRTGRELGTHRGAVGSFCTIACGCCMASTCVNWRKPASTETARAAAMRPVAGGASGRSAVGSFFQIEKRLHGVAPGCMALHGVASSGPLSRGTPWERVRVRVRVESRWFRTHSVLLSKRATTPRPPSPPPSPTEYRGRGRVVLVVLILISQRHGRNVSLLYLFRGAALSS